MGDGSSRELREKGRGRHLERKGPRERRSVYVYIYIYIYIYYIKLILK